MAGGCRTDENISATTAGKEAMNVYRYTGVCTKSVYEFGTDGTDGTELCPMLKGISGWGVTPFGTEGQRKPLWFEKGRLGRWSVKHVRLNTCFNLHGKLCPVCPINGERAARALFEHGTEILRAVYTRFYT